MNSPLTQTVPSLSRLFRTEALGSDAQTAFSRALDCLTHLKHRHLDARSWSCVAHDFADTVTCDGGAHADCGEPPHCPAGPPCGSDRRYGGSAQDVAIHARLDAIFSSHTRCAYGSRCDHSVVIADSYICSWRRRGDERPCLAGDDLGGCPWTDVPEAVALTGLGLNLARAVGPVVGGVLVMVTGAWAVFLLNAASFLGVMVVLSRWRRGPQPKHSPSKAVRSTIREGIRYATQAPALRAVLVRTGVFVPFASALWALLPLLARYELELNCFGYGILFGFLGMGSVIGATFLPKLQSHFSTDTLVAAATIMFAAATAALAEVRHFALLCLILMVAGMAWITLMTSFNVATQTAVPSWIRARALALYLLIFHGGMAAGSVLWGAVTQHAGVAVALFGAAGGLLVSLVAMAWYPLEESKQSDLTPSTHRDRAAECTPRVSTSAGATLATSNDQVTTPLGPSMDHEPHSEDHPNRYGKPSPPSSPFRNSST